MNERARRSALVGGIAVLATSLAACPDDDDPADPDVNASPVATLTSPDPGATYTAGETIAFSGFGTDVEDGALTGTALRWTSDRDGPLGQGASFTRTDLSVGAHLIRLIVRDSESAEDSATVTIEVEAAPDVTAPELDSLTIEPDTVDVSTDSATVTARLRVRDDISGTSTLSLVVESPGGGQSVATNASAPVSGTRHDGAWEATFVVPRYADAGTWTVTQVSLHDEAGNTRNLATEDLEDAGAGTELVVLADEDTVAPRPTSLEFEPDTVDVTLDSAIVVLDVSVTDSLSGAAGLSVILESPSGSQMAGVNTDSLHDGTPYDGVWRATLVVPAMSEPGEWTVQTLTLLDVAGNAAALDATALADLGLSYGIVVLNPDADTAAPTVTSLSLDPDTVASGPDVIEIDAQLSITDDLAGVDSILVSITAESGIYSFGRMVREPASGTRQDGLWQAMLEIPDSAEPGNWRLSVSLHDAAGNSVVVEGDALEQLGFDHEVRVLTPDTAYVRLLRVDFEPDTVDVTDASAEITWEVEFQSTNGVDLLTAHLFAPGPLQQEFDIAQSVVAGTQHDGVFRGTMTIRRYAESGAWVASLEMRNGTDYLGRAWPELAAMGFDSAVHVIDLNPDTILPAVTRVSVDPDSVELSGAPVNVTVEVDANDALAGVDAVRIALDPPTGSLLSVQVLSPTTGTNQDGTWIAQFQIPADGETGEWELRVQVEDGAGNYVTLDAATLAGEGFDDGVTVE